MSTLNKLMDGYNPHKALIDQTKGLVNKWEPTGLLEGLNGETETHGMSILLENQARQLIDESSKLVLVLILKNGLVLLYHWFVKSLVS